MKLLLKLYFWLNSLIPYLHKYIKGTERSFHSANQRFREMFLQLNQNVSNQSVV